MRGNPLLKWLVLPVLILIIVLAVKACSEGSARQSAMEEPGSRLTPEEMKVLGVDGDTPNDTVATLVGQTKALRTELQSLLGDNKTLKQENERLRSREAEIDSRIQTALSGEKNALQGEISRQQQARTALEAEKQELQNLLKGLKEQLPGSGSADIPVGLGLTEGDQAGFSGPSDGMVWVEPSDAVSRAPQGKGGSTKPAGFSFPNQFNPLTQAASEAADRAQNELHANPAALGGKIPATKKPARRVYTLPENSTLMGSIAMSALIGRVPVDGTVNDPYPFKVLIGPDNLTANGIDIPDVAGAVVSGTAAGDWTLSCVRGQIESLTFVFKDGRVRTLPAPEQVTSRQGNNSQNSDTSDLDSIKGGIGWISDPYGIPCISGERRSNAKQYIGTQSLITAAGAGIATLLDADEDSSASFFNSGSTSGGTTSSSGNSALNNILSGGVSDIREWVSKLYGEAFAAVYVRPGARVAIHLDRQLEIDYETDGRKIKHGSGATHVSRLD